MLAPRNCLEAIACICRTELGEVYNIFMVDFEHDLEELRQKREESFETKLAEQKIKKQEERAETKAKILQSKDRYTMSVVLKEVSEELGDDFHEDFASRQLIEEFLTRLFGPKRVFNSAVPGLSRVKGIFKETNGPSKGKFRAMDTFRLVKKDNVFDLGLRGNVHEKMSDAIADYRFRELVIGNSSHPVLNPTGTNQEYFAEVLPFLIGMDLTALGQTAQEQLIEYGRRIS